MKFLLKFVEKNKYADDVMRGSLYMNSLSYFWRVNYGEPLGASNSDRYDLFEGTYLSLNREDIGLEKEFANVIGLNPIVRLSAYQYINLFSAYHAEYNVDTRELIAPKIDTMYEFGKFVVVIIVFCKNFFLKVASNFSIVLQLHFPQCPENLKDLTVFQILLDGACPPPR